MKFFISVGSNIKPIETIKRSVGTLAQRLRIDNTSTFYKTDPVGMVPGSPPFVNGMLQGDTELIPINIWRLLRSIEKKYGRKRGADKYVSRTLDLDLILYGDWTMHTHELTIPDRHITERDFLAIPLKELDPKFVLPGDCRSISDLAPHAHTMVPMPGLTTHIRSQIDIYRRLHEYR